MGTIFYRQIIFIFWFILVLFYLNEPAYTNSFSDNNHKISRFVKADSGNISTNQFHKLKSTSGQNISGRRQSISYNQKSGYWGKANSNPYDISLSQTCVSENCITCTTAGSLFSFDYDVTDAHEYSLVSGTGDTNNESFSISGTSLMIHEIFDYETQSNYSIRVRSTDSNYGFSEKILTIDVMDINEAPEINLSTSEQELLINEISMPVNFTIVDSDSNNLTLSVISNNTQLIPSNFQHVTICNNGVCSNTDKLNFTITSEPDSLSLIIKPAINQSGIAIITLTINDGSSEISSQFTLTVNDGYMLAGSLNYYSGTNNPIPGAEILISGEYEYSATTNENGLYTIGNISPGDYTLTGSIDNNNGVSSDDATRIRRFKVSDNVSLNCYQKIAADVSRNGYISALDSSRVAIGSAKIEAGQQVCLQNDSCINWIFTKPIDDCNSLSTIEINNQISINSNINDLDIIGIRIGDVTGDWIANSPIGGNDSNTVLLIHSDNNEGDTSFNDSSGSMHSISSTGNVQHKQIDKVFGKSSIYFDGDGDYLTIQNHQDFTFGTDNFTIDAWIKMETGTTLWQTIFAKSSGNYQGIIFDVNPDGRIEFVAGNGSWLTSIHTSTGVAPVDQWIHIAVVREGTGTNQVKIYLNGQIAAQGTYSGNYGDSSTNVTIGAYTWSANRNKGFLDEIRVSKGIARTLDPDDPMYDPEGDGFVLPESIYSN